MKSVCVDLDGVLATYEGWRGLDHIGEPRHGARDFLQHLSQVARVIIFTTRCKLGDPDLGRPDHESVATLYARVKEWLDQHKLPYSEIYTGQGKPMACAYVDDRAVSIPTNPSAEHFSPALARVLELIAH